MEDDSGDEFPADFLAALKEQRGLDTIGVTSEAVESFDAESICTFSDEDESYRIHSERPIASSDGKSKIGIDEYLGLEEGGDSLDQIQELIQSELSAEAFDQLSEMLRNDEEDPLYSHIDEGVSHNTSIHSTSPHVFVETNNDTSCANPIYLAADDAVEHHSQIDMDNALSVSLSDSSMIRALQSSLPAPPPSQSLLGLTKQALAQEQLKEASSVLTPSQLFAATMSRIMKMENPNFNALSSQSGLSRNGSLSDDGYSMNRSVRSSKSGTERRGSIMRRGTYIQQGDDSIPVGNLYSDVSGNNQRRRVSRKMSVGSTPQLRDFLGSPELSKNEAFRERSTMQWSSTQLLLKRNLERHCLGIFRKNLSAPVNNGESTSLNFETFGIFLEEMFALPQSSQTASSIHLRETAYLVANCLGGEKAPKLEFSLKRLTLDKLSLVALVPGVSLAGCMLLVLIAYGLYSFEDEKLNKLITDLRLAKLQNKLHAELPEDHFDIPEHEAFCDTLLSLDYEHCIERSKRRQEGLKELAHKEFKQVHTFSPQIIKKPPAPPLPPPRAQPLPPPGSPPAMDSDESLVSCDESVLLDENEFKQNLFTNYTPFGSPVVYNHEPVTEASVFERLYNRCKPPLRVMSPESGNDDESLATANTWQMGTLTNVPPPSAAPPRRSRLPLQSQKDKEDLVVKEECTFKPKINPCPFISPRSIKTILDIVNPSGHAPPVVSVIIDDEVEDARAEFRTVLSDLVEPGLPVYYYNKRWPPLCAQKNSTTTVSSSNGSSKIPRAPLLPPPDYFKVATPGDMEALKKDEAIFRSRAHSVMQRSNSIIKGVEPSKPPDWSGLLVELTTKIGGGLLRLNSITELKDIKKLPKSGKTKKGKKKVFKDVMEEMKHFLGKYKSLDGLEDDENGSDGDEEDEEPKKGQAAPQSNHQPPLGRRGRVVLVPTTDITPAGTFRQMKPAVKVGISKIPPPPPLPGTEDKYIEPPPVPIRVYATVKSRRWSSSDQQDTSPTSQRETEGNVSELLALAMGRNAFGGQLEGKMTNDIASDYDDNEVLDPGYYLPAPEDVAVPRGRLLFRGITGEDMELDEEVLSHLELLGATAPPPFAATASKRKSLIASTNTGDVNDVTGIWRGKITVNDLPLPKSYNLAVDKLRRAKESRRAREKTKWAHGMRNYGEFPENYSERVDADAEEGNGSVSSASGLNRTVVKPFTLNIDMRSAEAKKKLNIPTYRKTEAPSDYDKLPLQKRIPEKIAAKTAYSQQGGDGLAEAFWTATLRDYDSTARAPEGSDASVSTVSVSVASKTPRPPKFHDVSRVERRRMQARQREEEMKRREEDNKRKVKQRLHNQAVPPNQRKKDNNYQQKVARKYTNQPDVGFDVSAITVESARNYHQKHGTWIPPNQSPNQNESLFHFDDMTIQSSPPMSYLDGMSGFDTPRVSLCGDNCDIDESQDQNYSPDANIKVSYSNTDGPNGEEYEDTGASVFFQSPSIRNKTRHQIYAAAPQSRGGFIPPPPPRFPTNKPSATQLPGSKNNILNPSNTTDRLPESHLTTNLEPDYPDSPPPPPPPLPKDFVSTSKKPPPPPPPPPVSSHVLPPPPPKLPKNFPLNPNVVIPVKSGNNSSNLNTMSPMKKGLQRPPPPPPPRTKGAVHNRRNKYDDIRMPRGDDSDGELSTESSSFYQSNYLLNSSVSSR